MPLVVNVLESLDIALIENQQLQVELELCKDDNEQLVAAFEKEKTNKKKVDQKLIELEFASDEEKQAFQQKVDSLENLVKILELKAKNSADHGKYYPRNCNQTALIAFGLLSIANCVSCQIAQPVDWRRRRQNRRRSTASCTVATRNCCAVTAT